MGQSESKMATLTTFMRSVGVLDAKLTTGNESAAILDEQPSGT